jgi:hypothetical protein
MPTDETGRHWSIGSTLMRSSERTTLLALGFISVVTGGLLLFQRSHANGFRLWPIILVAVGLVGIGSAPPEERDEALWLVGTGCWLLMTSLAPAFFRGAGPLVMVGAGLATFRWALAPNAAAATPESSHGN